MKCKINCIAMSKNFKGDTVRDWEITPEGRVWPCCYYSNAWDKRNANSSDYKLFTQDKVIMEQFERDFYWNDLNTYSLEEIINHELYWTHIFSEGWDSDNPPIICEEECKIGIDENTGEEVGASVLSVKLLRGDDT